MRILWLGDTPTIKTGFGKINREVIKRLDPERFEVDVVGVNYDASPLHVLQDWPGRIFAANPGGHGDDYLGRQLAVDLMTDAKQRGNPYDIFFAHTDIQLLNAFTAPLAAGARDQLGLAGVVFYAPLDSELQRHVHWLDAVGAPDVFITYTHWAAAELSRFTNLHVKVVQLATEPIPQLSAAEIMEFRAEIAGDGEKNRKLHRLLTDPDAAVVVSVNRNQERKDLPRLLEVFAAYRQNCRHPAVLYMHTDPVDLYCDLNMVAYKLGLEDCVAFPSHAMRMSASAEYMQRIYNMAHCVVSLSRGEGWGLSVSEGMAAKRPVIAALNTAAIELLGGLERTIPFLGKPVHVYARGIAVPSGGRYLGESDPNFWVYGADGMHRPLADIPSAANALEYVLTQCWGADYKWEPKDEKVGAMLDNAFRAASGDTWDKAAASFTKIFDFMVENRGSLPVRRKLTNEQSD